MNQVNYKNKIKQNKTNKQTNKKSPGKTFVQTGPSPMQSYIGVAWTKTSYDSHTAENYISKHIALVT